MVRREGETLPTAARTQGEESEKERDNLGKERLTSMASCGPREEGGRDALPASGGFPPRLCYLSCYLPFPVHPTFICPLSMLRSDARQPTIVVTDSHSNSRHL